MMVFGDGNADFIFALRIDDDLFSCSLWVTHGLFVVLSLLTATVMRIALRRVRALAEMERAKRAQQFWERKDVFEPTLPPWQCDRSNL